MGCNGEDMKRKRKDGNKAGGEDGNTKRKKKKLKGVLQFIDAAAAVDDKEPIDEIVEEEFSSDFETNNELQVFQPFSEMNNDEEFDKMFEDYYKAGSSLVTVAEYGFYTEPSIVSSAEDPTVWKVKCVVGRERHSAFCLMQKFVDLKSLGTELQIVSVFTLEHKRGFIFIEAYKQWHINEACKGICNINCNNVSPVPENELLQLLHVRSKCTEISAGTWVRVKNGKYKGDLAQVVALNKSNKKATVKLVPRIDLQAFAEKIGRGVSSKKTAIPRARLISSKELDEFRPLIQHKRDRDLGEVFEVLDGMMLKDGYLFKKVPVESLIFWGLTLSENELLNFEQSGGNESKDQEWLSLLYGEKNTILIGNEGVRGDCSSVVSSFQVHDLVFFGQKHFGVIIEVEEDDNFKILKEDCEGPVIVSIKQDELKKAFFNKKLTALDHHMNVVCFNDSLRVLEGPLKDRQGVVKHIYRGTVFLQDENEQENNGYFCCKAQNCEKIKISVDGSDTKGVESQASGSEKIISSLKSPVLAKKRSNSNSNLENKDGKFSIGQSLRIRVGPLKGYLCRVMAIQESNVTVKLDSQHKILTVECAKLCIPGENKSAISKGSGVPGSSNLLGIQDGTKGRVDGAAISMETKRMKSTIGLSNKRISRPGFPASSFLRRPEIGFANRVNQQNHALKKGNSVVVKASSWRGAIKKGMGDEKEAKIRIGENNMSDREKSMGQGGQGFGGWNNKRMMVNKDEQIRFGSGTRGGGGIFGVRRSLGGGQHPLTFANGRGQQNNGGRSDGIIGGRGRGRGGGSGGWKGGNGGVAQWNKPQAPSSTWRKQGGGGGGETWKSFGGRGSSSSNNLDQQQNMETTLKQNKWKHSTVRGRGRGRGRGRARVSFPRGGGGRVNFGRGGFGQHNLAIHNFHN